MVIDLSHTLGGPTCDGRHSQPPCEKETVRRFTLRALYGYRSH